MVGNQRGGAKGLAVHLLKEENDHVEVHQLRGFASESLPCALNEAYAISRGTRCKQFMFSLSLNPPPGENVSTEVFEKAIEQVEARLNLTDQPRAIVFHEKEGRRHAHAVWSRIDAEEMKAVQLSHSKRKLQTVSRELFLEHGWKMPRGLTTPKERDPRNFTLAEWQQAKRQGKDPRAIKEAIQDAWAISDSKAAFTHALEENGYKLARGDRRGFVAVDHKGHVHALGKKWLGVPTKEIRSRLGEETKLQSVSEAKERFAQEMSATMERHRHDLETEQRRLKELFEGRKKELVDRQRIERRNLTERHQSRQLHEAKERQSRFRPGLKGVWDHLRGTHKHIQKQNVSDAYRSVLRDRTEKDDLIFGHLDKRRQLVGMRKQELKTHFEQRQEIKSDVQNYARMATEAREARLRAYLDKRRSPQSREGPQKRRDSGPEREL